MSRRVWLPGRRRLCDSSAHSLAIPLCFEEAGFRLQIAGVIVVVIPDATFDTDTSILLISIRVNCERNSAGGV